MLWFHTSVYPITGSRNLNSLLLVSGVICTPVPWGPKPGHGSVSLCPKTVEEAVLTPNSPSRWMWFVSASLFEKYTKHLFLCSRLQKCEIRKKVSEISYWVFRDSRPEVSLLLERLVNECLPRAHEAQHQALPLSCLTSLLQSCHFRCFLSDSSCFKESTVYW